MTNFREEQEHLPGNVRPRRPSSSAHVLVGAIAVIFALPNAAWACGGPEPLELLLSVSLGSVLVALAVYGYLFRLMKA